MPIRRGPNPAVAKLVGAARFVFTGTVEQDSSSSLSFLPAGPNTSIVRVERIHHAPPALHNQIGQQVTVLSDAGSAPPTRERHCVFFTNPILYGETMAVRQVGNIEVPDNIEELHELIVLMTGEARMDELLQHIESAHAVVHGEVVALRPPSEPPAVNRSEHDPDWWIAIVRVERSLKGNLKGQIEVHYPNSRDIAWYRVPKPQQGDEGIFILHRDAPKLEAELLAIVHPVDFLPGDAREARRIGELVRPRRSRS